MLFKRIGFCIIIIINSLIVSAQDTKGNFANKWLEIDSLLVHNLTESALNKVNLLYTYAEKDPTQQIKSLIYQLGLEERIKENSINKNIQQLNDALAKAKEPAIKAILHTLIAKKYFDYFSVHRWQFYNRSTTERIKKNDIETWSARDFFSAINYHYQVVLKSAENLKSINLNEFNDLLIKGNTRQIRPSLFDLLAHDALNYYKTSEGLITKPINYFTINQAIALANCNEFVNAKFATTDSNSHEFISLQIFQQLLSFHLNDSNKVALVDLDLERLEWVNQQGIIPNKEALYQKALYAITEKYSNNPVAANAWVVIARSLIQQAEHYQTFGDTTNRWDYVAAKKIIDKTIADYPTEIFALDALKELQQKISTINLHTITEKINLPEKPFRTLVQYKNVDTLYYKIIDISKYQDWQDIYLSDSIVKIACLVNPIKNGHIVLPNTHDFQSHAVEIKIDALPFGNYLLLSASNKDFSINKSPIAFQHIIISGISFIQNKEDLFVLDRATGTPIKNAQVSIFIEKRNLSSKNDRWEKLSENITDQNGYFKLQLTKESNYCRLVIQNGKDKLALLNSVFGNNNFNENLIDKESEKIQFEKNNRQTYFFTDRSIYKPGQTIYFKGLVTTKDFETKNSKIIPKHIGKVYLHDANYATIDSIEFQSNGYGSFSGQFVLPSTSLTGNFTISLTQKENGRTTVSVENYKPASFSVQFNKNTERYEINDTIKLTGFVKAYAGNNLNNCKLNYRIQLNTRSTNPTMFLRNNIKWNVPTEIAHGLIETDSSGNFSVPFKAIVTETIDSLVNPLFDYMVDITATDGSGESRSARTNITCGYQTEVLELLNDPIFSTDSAQKIKAFVRNLNYGKIPGTIQLNINVLTNPGRIIRSRYWQRPDQFVMDQETFLKQFPSDEYLQESNFKTWPKGLTVFQGSIDTKTSNELAIPNSVLKPGYYSIVASYVNNKAVVINKESYVQIVSNTFSNNYNITPTNIYETQTIEPNETAQFFSETMAKELFIIRETFTNQVPRTYSFEYRKKGLHSTAYKASELDRGGARMNEVYVYDNRVYQRQLMINVPWTNKALNIKYSSYRNKLAPGSKEQWTISIENAKGNQQPAELLTNLYDASLDAFKNHNWYLPNLWRNSNYSNNWIGDLNFRQQYGSSTCNNCFNESEKNLKTYDLLANDVNDLWKESFLAYKKKKLAPFVNRDYGNMPFLYYLKPGSSLDERVVVGYGNPQTIRIRGSSSPALYNASKAKQEEDYDKVYTSVDLFDEKTGEHIINGRIVNRPSKFNEFETENISVRKNFTETAFFFPQLKPDSAGNYQFSFQMPDAVTKWKWLSFAHTKDLSIGINSAEIQTQKILMVQTNPPRFMREGDKMEFSARIANLSAEEMTGQVSLELIDATSNTSIDGWFQNIFPAQYFTISAKQNAIVKFPIQIPFGFNRPLIWRVTAKAGNYTDAEENTLPILPNRQLVTESMPMILLADTTQLFTFKKLLEQNSNSASNESLTVEYTSNPIWHAITALPYLLQKTNESVEQTFNRFYANSLAVYLVKKYPIIKNYYTQWKTDSVSLLANLNKNQGLKQIILQETPWVFDAKNETAQRSSLSQLFNLVQVSEQASTDLNQLKDAQLSNGSFSWFKGGREDLYMTNTILTGIGKLLNMGAISAENTNRLNAIVIKAIEYLDAQTQQDYTNLITSKQNINVQQLTRKQIEYLYMRSFYLNIPNKASAATDYYYKQAKLFWKNQPIQLQAMLGLAFYRHKEWKLVRTTLFPAILENAVKTSSMGTYWKEPNGATAQISTQSLVIELAETILYQTENEGLENSIAKMRTWLLLNKQTMHWKTTIATANACYALLLNTNDLTNNNSSVELALGKTIIKSSDQKTTAGFGYWQKRIDGNIVEPSMGNIKVITTTNQPKKFSNTLLGWGSIEWQYFEELDKITEAANDLSVTKKIFIETNTGAGKKLVPISLENPLQVGNKIIIRLEIHSSRDMNYVHLKDMRAASMEPLNVLSGYKWKEQLGYYESTNDASTNFFFDFLPKGTYVFEYPLYITHAGDFSAGIATLKSIYAPELSSHSAGMNISVVE